jgi:hypothetical protein
MNEFCSKGTNNKKYYFIMDPHALYEDPSWESGTDPNRPYTLIYEVVPQSNSSIKQTISFSRFNWNYVAIHVNFSQNYLKFYTNFNTMSPTFTNTNIKNLKLTLNNVLFCSSKTNCNSGTGVNAYTDVFWGAAFYKNLRIWGGVNTNSWVVHEYSQNTFNDVLKTYFYDFPFKLIN